MTAILLVADYYVYKLNADVGRMDMIPNYARQTKNNYKPYIRKLPYVAIFLTVFSTFIWGYGDILFREMNLGG